MITAIERYLCKNSVKKYLDSNKKMIILSELKNYNAKPNILVESKFRRYKKKRI